MDGVREPSDLGCDAARTVCEGASDRFADARAAANAIEEVRLEDPGDAEGGRSKEDAQGGRRADEEVLRNMSATFSPKASAVQLTCLYGPLNLPSGLTVGLSASSMSKLLSLIKTLGLCCGLCPIVPASL